MCPPPLTSRRARSLRVLCAAFKSPAPSALPTLPLRLAATALGFGDDTAACDAWLKGQATSLKLTGGGESGGGESGGGESGGGGEGRGDGGGGCGKAEVAGPSAGTAKAATAKAASSQASAPAADVELPADGPPKDQSVVIAAGDGARAVIHVKTAWFE